MPRRLITHPVAYTVVGTIASVAVSFGITGLALWASGVEFLPVAMFLSIGLPLTVAPLTMYPLIAMVNRQRALRQELEKLVLTDVLTELPNRRAFFEYARPFFDERFGVNAPLTAMMIDVDHFKLINDSYGHDAGDIVLKRVAGVIRDEVAAAGSPDWTVARIGGEEFAVIIDHLVPTAVARLAERICGQVHRWVGAGENQEPVTVSVGVAFCLPGMGIDKLLKAADDAVYVAKRGGRDRWAFAGDTQNDGMRRIISKPLPEPANDRVAAG
jgi:diguanylate cyclase (GGDEF)-like protein